MVQTIEGLQVARNPHRISMRGFAEVAAAAPKRKASVFRKYRSPESEESVGRSNYYAKAISGIRHHHKGETDFVSHLLKELFSAAALESNNLKCTKYLNNHRALTSYLEHFGDRKLVIMPGKQLYFTHGGLLVSAKPDLVAEEAGEMVLIKLNLTKKNFAGGVNPMLLHLLYEAAKKADLSVSPTRVETLQVATGSRVTGPRTGFPKLSVLNAACDEVLSFWSAS